MKLIKKEFLTKFRNKLVNFHPGILPNYRGLYSTFYKLINKDKYFGISSHFMREKIDSGPIIAIVKNKIKNQDLFDCYNKLYRKMIFKLLFKTLKKFNTKKRIIESKKVERKIYAYPILAQVLKYKFL